MVPVILKLKAGSGYLVRASARLSRSAHGYRFANELARRPPPLLPLGVLSTARQARKKTVGLSLLDAAAPDLVLGADHTMKKHHAHQRLSA